MVTIDTAVHALEKFPTGKQAHNNNFQNPQKCGPRGMTPLSTLIDQTTLWFAPQFSKNS